MLRPMVQQLLNLLLSTALLLGAATAAHAGERAAITVYRSASCECCTAWENHLSTAGFAVTDVVSDNLGPVKSSHGITAELESCHTAVVKGYVIEGHVPASAIQSLLRAKPSIRGLTAPGMPMGSPGMDGEGITPEPFDVLAIDTDGGTQVFERYIPHPGTAVKSSPD